MQTKALGKSGINASVIGLGTYYFGGGDGTAPPKAQDIMKIIHSALDEGITLMDTAPSYGFGHCEQIIGKALKGRRDQAVIATKCGLWWQDQWISKWAERWQRPIYKFALEYDQNRSENSLRYLNTDYLDLLQVINSNLSVSIEEPWDCLGHKLKF